MPFALPLQSSSHLAGSSLRFDMLPYALCPMLFSLFRLFSSFFYLGIPSMKNYIYHLIIGGNLGDRVKQLSLAKHLIASEVGVIQKESSIYETQPWGYDDQPWFLNQVLEISTLKTPGEVLMLIKTIEVKVGRTPSEKWHARHIDIDILLRGDLVLKESTIEIPHPLLQTRNFVLVPLLELIPEQIHPELCKTIEELYLDCRDTGEVYIFNPDEQGHSV